MKRNIFLVLILLLVIGLAVMNCKDKKGEEEDVNVDSADEIVTLIEQMTSFDANEDLMDHPWHPGVMTAVTDETPHDVKHSIKFNQTAFDHFQITGSNPFVAGSVIIIFNMNDAEEVTGICVKAKTDSDEYSDVGGWHWYEFDADKKLVEDGKMERCVNCHSQWSGNDYVNPSIHEF